MTYFQITSHSLNFANGAESYSADKPVWPAN